MQFVHGSGKRKTPIQRSIEKLSVPFLNYQAYWGGKISLKFL